MASIAECLISPLSYTVMRYFLEESAREYFFHEMTQLITYPQAEKVLSGSNDCARFQDAVTEFELLLAALESKEIKNETGVLTFPDLLYFITGSDRVPPHGFEKLIDICFDDISLPTAYTCGLSAVFPYTGMKDAFIIALKFGGGFGSI